MNNLHNKPVAPAADFLNDSDSKASFEQLKAYLYEQALYEEVSAAAALRLDVPVEKLEDHQRDWFIREFVDESAMKEFETRATSLSMVKADKVQQLANRVSMSFAFKMLKGDRYKTAEQFDSFTKFLLNKLDRDPSEKSTQEAVFLLEYIAAYEERSGRKGAADELFSNAVRYNKMVAMMPGMRKKFSQLEAAERQVKDQVTELTKEAGTLRKKKSEARLRGEKVEVLDQIEDEIKATEEKVVEVQTKSKPAIEKLHLDFTATTLAASEIAKSKDVRREEAAAALPKLAALKLEQMGHDPADVSPEYDSSNTTRREVEAKPVAYTIHSDTKVVIMAEINSRFLTIVVNALSVLFDVRIGSLDEGRALLDKHNNVNGPKAPVKKKEEEAWSYV